MAEGVKKSTWFFLASFLWRKPESSVFKVLAIHWTPVFTGVTTEIQFFHTFGEGRVGVMSSIFFAKFRWTYKVVMRIPVAGAIHESPLRL